MNDSKLGGMLLGMTCAVLLCGCQGIKQPDNPNAAHYNVELGLGYLQRHDMQRAKQKLLKALTQAPQSPEANDAMAYYAEVIGDNRQAAYYYQYALKLAPNSGAPLNNYGAFLCRQGQYQQAERYFMRAIADHTYLNTAAVYENAGLCALAIPDRDAAKQYFKQALKQNPYCSQAKYQLTKLGL